VNVFYIRRNHIEMTAYYVVGKVTPLYAVIRPSWLYPITLHIQARAHCIRRRSFKTSKRQPYFSLRSWV